MEEKTIHVGESTIDVRVPTVDAGDGNINDDTRNEDRNEEEVIPSLESYAASLSNVSIL